MFRTRPDRPWGPASLRCSGYRVSFPGVKRPGRGVNHPPPVSAEVKERVGLYLYSPLWTFVACYRVKFSVYLYLYCSPASWQMSVSVEVTVCEQNQIPRLRKVKTSEGK